MGKRLWLIIGAALIMAGVSVGQIPLAYADNPVPLSNFNPSGYTVKTSFSNIFNAIVQWMIIIASILLLIYLLWGGIDWITSGGDKGKAETAINKIKFALLGIIFVACSWAVFTLVMKVAFNKDVSSGFTFDTPSL